MYVTQRGPKFRAWERVVLPDGTIKKISVTMDRDTPQARKKAEKALRAKQIALTPKSSDITYSELVAAYIEFQRATLKPSTCRRNEASLKRLSDTFGNARLSYMTAGFISGKLLKKTTDPGTYNEYLKRLKAMFRWAYRMDYIKSPECVDKVKPLKEKTEAQKVADKYLEADELKAVLDASSEYYRNIFEFLALSGLRIGELIALNDEDVTDTEIIVNKTYDAVNDTTSTPKTFASIRSVHIQPELADCIARVRQMSRLHSMISGTRYPYFAVNARGGHLSYYRTNRLFRAACERVTGKSLTLHALRHTHVALMAEKGIELDAISRRLGHSGTKITREIYYHCTEKQREKDNAAFDAVSIFA